MLVKLAEAIGRISLAGRELTRLAGYTERVMQLMIVLEDLNQGKYQRTMVQNKDDTNNKANQNKTNEFKPNSGKMIYHDNIIKYLK
jgi:ATP-binding cassette subfamily D (ALD) protein 3